MNTKSGWILRGVRWVGSERVGGNLNRITLIGNELCDCVAVRSRMGAQRRPMCLVRRRGRGHHHGGMPEQVCGGSDQEGQRHWRTVGAVDRRTGAGGDGTDVQSSGEVGAG